MGFLENLDKKCMTRNFIIVAIVAVIIAVILGIWLSMFATLIVLLLLLLVGFYFAASLCRAAAETPQEIAPETPAPVQTPAPEPAPEPEAEATPEPEPEVQPTPESEPEAAPEPDTGKPALLSEARDGKGDDLKKIKGVGPKLEKELNAAGVYHFDQIAAWSKAEVEWADQNLVSFKGRVSRDNWVDQAKELAK